MEVVTGEHLELAGLEPAFGVTGVAFAAAAVFAAMVGEHLMRAVIAPPEVPSEGFGAAGQAAEDVGDLDHDRRQRPVISSSRMPVRAARVGSVRWV